MRTLSLGKQIVFWEIDGETVLDSGKDKLLVQYSIFDTLGVILRLVVGLDDDPLLHRLNPFRLLVDVVSSHVG